MLISKTIDDALVEIGVNDPSDEATPQDHEFGLRSLNRIVDLFNTQNLLITYSEDMEFLAPYTTNECESADPDDFTVRLWNSSVTIGHCQDINQAAPMDIQGLFWRQDGTDYQSKPMTLDEWASISFKEVEGIPTRHYIQRIDNNNVKIFFDMIPQSILKLHIQAKMPYTGKNSVGNEFIPTDDINWGYGFEKMLMKRLAVELAPSYGVEASAIVISSAIEAENYVKSYNYQPRTLSKTSTFGRNRFVSRNNRARY